LGGVPEALIEDNAKKWSGDHLIEPSFVPGVLFTSFPLETEVASIGDVPSLVGTTLDLDGVLPAERIDPSTGWLDLASPALSWIDDALSALLPSTLRIVLWGVLASLGSMLIYKWTSNQTRIAELKDQGLEIRKKLNTFDGDPGELWPLLGRNLAIAGRHLGLTLIPAMISSIPVLMVLIWMSNAFDASVPPVRESVVIKAIPDATHQLPPLRWEGGEVEAGERPGSWTISWPEVEAPMRLVDSDGITLLTLPTEAPVSNVHQRRWWNDLIGNPAGYLPSPGDVDAVVLAMPSEEFQPFGPWWLRSWITLFFAVVVIASLGLKFLWRLQ